VSSPRRTKVWPRQPETKLPEREEPSLNLASLARHISVDDRDHLRRECWKPSGDRGCAEQDTVESQAAKEVHVADEKNIELQELSAAELELEAAEELPDREEMSLINANVAAPINAALALNVLSDNSVAYADATQTAPIIQST
jgi:hypothetical protein